MRPTMLEDDLKEEVGQSATLIGPLTGMAI
jgi:hypothetical protein